MGRNVWSRFEKPNFIRGRHWKYVVRILGLIVVFCTTYALILPAITMDQSTICGKEVHTHTDGCVDPEATGESVYICGYEAHTHTKECYPVEEPEVQETSAQGSGTGGQSTINVEETRKNYQDSTTNQESTATQQPTAAAQPTGTPAEGLAVADSQSTDSQTAVSQPMEPQPTVPQPTEPIQLQALTEDAALITSLEAVYTVEAPEAVLGVQNETTVMFGFQMEMQADTDAVYGDARVKVQFTLPVSEELAVFDLEAMPWLEDAVITTETETVDEIEVVRQVLVGYVSLYSADPKQPVIPGGYTQNVAVKLIGMEIGATLELQIQAAMEHNCWDTICETHGRNEVLSIASKSVTITEPLVESEPVVIDENAAEPGGGSNWEAFKNSGWEKEYENAANQSAVAEKVQLPDLSEYLMSKNPALMALGDTSEQQILGEGGSNESADGVVVVSKTIAATNQENVFDITLDIITNDVVTEIYKEPDMAVVIVMDISNTMTKNFGGSTRYEAAMTAAEKFLDQFAENNLGVSRVGFVAFNSDAHEIFPLKQCTSSNLASIKNEMRQKTLPIIKQDNYDSSHKRFTNIEGGLKRASDMLDGVTNKNKYIIFLSDGFPTTYIESGYKGYDTYDAAGVRFKDRVLNKACSIGTSYSDEAAIRARKMATTVKGKGTKIFSIGVDIGGQKIQNYINQANDGVYVVDRYKPEDKADKKAFEIGGPSDATAYTSWLTNSIGSGNGYYFASTNVTGLTNAFEQIYAKMKELNASSSHLDWVATDPMPGMGVHGASSIEFIGFFTREGVLTTGNLVGESGNGWEYENTASFDVATQFITWDIKKSGYIGIGFDNNTMYECSLRYRVRLMNENDNFIERGSYDTNDVTSLTYRVIEQNNTTVTVSEQRKIDFPIPKVEGYLSELDFKKIDSVGNAVNGAEFTLHHDTEHCGYCRGDGSSYVTIEDDIVTSGLDGMVRFTNIPSGHTYSLTETKVPDGYRDTGNTYQVTVAYDSLSVTVKDSSGNVLNWDNTIENGSSYTLPNTGGRGTSLYTISGLLISAVVGVYVTLQIGRKKYTMR